MELVELLKMVGLFAGLQDEQRERLAEVYHALSYKDGDIVVKQGDPGDEMYIIAEGQFEVILGETPETAHSAVYLGQGQIFGEMAIIDYGERSATIRCASETGELYSIDRNVLLNLCASNTDIGFILMRNMASDLSFKLRHRNLESESG